MQLNAPRIVVVGSYATGLTMKVDRLPGSGETLLGTGYRVDYGGKGSNQAVACARLGASVSFIAKIGNDAFGEMAMGSTAMREFKPFTSSKQQTLQQGLVSSSSMRTLGTIASQSIRAQTSC